MKALEQTQKNYIVEYNVNSTLINNLKTFDDITKFKVRMMSISKSLGISNAPDAMQLSATLVFLQRNFGNAITVAEFSYAFELYALQRLNVDKSKHHFHTFNFEFIAAVMYAYMEYRKPSLQNHAKSQEENLLPPHEITWMEHAEQHNKIVEDYIAEHNTVMPNGVLIPVDWEAVFDYLQSKGEINMTNEQRQAFKEEHKMTLLETAHATRGTIMSWSYQQLLDQANDETYLAWSCRRQCAINYYQSKIKTK